MGPTEGPPSTATTCVYAGHQLGVGTLVVTGEFPFGERWEGRPSPNPGAIIGAKRKRDDVHLEVLQQVAEGLEQGERQSRTHAWDNSPADPGRLFKKGKDGIG